MAFGRWKRTMVLGFGVGIGALALPGAAAVGGEDGAPTRIEVDVSQRELYLYHGGELVRTYSIAVGEPEHPTPRGQFEIDRIIWNPAWVPPDEGWAADDEKKDPNEEGNPMVGAKLFFEYPDYYIHGTDAPATLGEAESHGCIRMLPSEVMDLARFVQEHGGEVRNGSWYDRVQRNDESKHEVTLPDPVPVEIHD